MARDAPGRHFRKGLSLVGDPTMRPPSGGSSKFDGPVVRAARIATPPVWNQAQDHVLPLPRLLQGQPTC